MIFHLISDNNDLEPDNSDFCIFKNTEISKQDENTIIAVEQDF